MYRRSPRPRRSSLFIERSRKGLLAGALHAAPPSMPPSPRVPPLPLSPPFDSRWLPQRDAVDLIRRRKLAFGTHLGDPLLGERS